MARIGNPPRGGNLNRTLHPSFGKQDLTDQPALSQLTEFQLTGPNWTQFLRVPEILDLLTLSRSCLYDQISDEVFPPLVKFGPRTAQWPVEVLDALVRNRIELREGMTHLRQRIVMPHWTPWCPQASPVVRNFDLEDLQLLRVAEVAAKLGVSVPTVYRFIRRRGLPGPLPLTSRARRWIAWEVTQWMNSCVAVSLRISGELPPRASRRKNGRSVPEDRPRR